MKGEGRIRFKWLVNLILRCWPVGEQVRFHNRAINRLWRKHQEDCKAKEARDV